ncbi:hypothetical protein Ancab_020951 [Ancistrocladus abbreviatus]
MCIAAYYTCTVSPLLLKVKLSRKYREGNLGAREICWPHSAAVPCTNLACTSFVCQYTLVSIFAGVTVKLADYIKKLGLNGLQWNELPLHGGDSSIERSSPRLKRHTPPLLEKLELASITAKLKIAEDSVIEAGIVPVPEILHFYQNLIGISRGSEVSMPRRFLFLCIRELLGQQQEMMYAK